jgi:hypothetical protein
MAALEARCNRVIIARRRAERGRITEEEDGILSKLCENRRLDMQERNQAARSRECQMRAEVERWKTVAETNGWVRY